MRVGQRVMLVGCDDFMPPLGACGVIVGPIDWLGDHEVVFPDHPWSAYTGSTLDTDSWEIPARWLMPLDDGFEGVLSFTHAEVTL